MGKYVNLISNYIKQYVDSRSRRRNYNRYFLNGFGDCRLPYDGISQKNENLDPLYYFLDSSKVLRKISSFFDFLVDSPEKDFFIKGDFFEFDENLNVGRYCFDLKISQKFLKTPIEDLEKLLQESFNQFLDFYNFPYSGQAVFFEDCRYKVNLYFAVNQEGDMFLKNCLSRGVKCNNQDLNPRELRNQANSEINGLEEEL